MVKVSSQSLQIPRWIRMLVWLASWACRLRHPCPITEATRHIGQKRSISPGLPSASFHAITTITSAAKAASRSPRETLSGWPPSLPTESHFHLEEKPQLLSPEACHLRLAGKTITPSATLFTTDLFADSKAIYSHPIQ